MALGFRVSSMGSYEVRSHQELELTLPACPASCCSSDQCWDLTCGFGFNTKISSSQVRRSYSKV